MQEQRSRRIITAAALAGALGACAPDAAVTGAGGADVPTGVHDGAAAADGGAAGDAFVRAASNDAAGGEASPACTADACADTGPTGADRDAGAGSVSDGGAAMDAGAPGVDAGGDGPGEVDAGVGGDGADAREPDPVASDAGTGVASCAPPRLIAPLSTATVASSRPVLRWEAAGAVTVELCADRGCARVLDTLESDGGSGARAGAALPPGTVFWRAFAGRGATRCAASSPVWQFRVPRRDGPGDASGGTVPDFDGDGLADVAVGMENAVAVYTGARTGVALAPRWVVRPPARAPGEAPRTLQYGLHVVSAGDLDGDGFADLAVGGSSGEVLVYRGGPAGPGPDAVVALRGDAADAEFGKVSAAGDVNGDGFGDVLVLASNVESGGASHAYLFAGGPGGPSPSPAAALEAPGGMHFGLAVPGAAAADFDGDGFGDVALSLSGTGVASRVVVFAGSSAGLSAAPRVALEMTDEPAGALLEVLSPGDLDGDGFADVMAGVSGGAGGLVLLRGGPGGLGVLPAVRTGLAAGWSLRGGRDLNGDGTPDLLVAGAPSPGSVAVYLLGAGGVPGPAASAELPNPPAPGGAGPTAPEGVGVDDVDGDGFADVVLRDEARGVVEVYRSGSAGPSGPPATRLAPPAGALAFGRAVAPACD